jgi:uncharacterized membrane protein YphA (DoxX/SURF4 family)
MFTIIGGDGREYGPASTEQIRAWLASGRANLETRAKAAGSDEWRRLGDYAEFSEGAGAPPVIVAVDTGLADRGVRLLAKIVDEICSLICAIPGAAILGVTFLRTWIQSMNGGEAASLEDIDVGRAVTGFTVLALGLFSRFASPALLVVMSFAYVTADREALFSIFRDTDKFTGADPFLFLSAALLVFVFGPGKFSLDALVRKKA